MRSYQKQYRNLESIIQHTLRSSFFFYKNWNTVCVIHNKTCLHVIGVVQYERSAQRHWNRVNMYCLSFCLEEFSVFLFDAGRYMSVIKPLLVLLTMAVFALTGVDVELCWPCWSRFLFIFLSLARLFWNQIFTCEPQSQNDSPDWTNHEASSCTRHILCLMHKRYICQTSVLVNFNDADISALHSELFLQ